MFLTVFFTENLKASSTQSALPASFHFLQYNSSLSFSVFCYSLFSSLTSFTHLFPFSLLFCSSCFHSDFLSFSFTIICPNLNLLCTPFFSNPPIILSCFQHRPPFSFLSHFPFLQTKASLQFPRKKKGFNCHTNEGLLPTLGSLLLFLDWVPFLLIFLL